MNYQESSKAVVSSSLNIIRKLLIEIINQISGWEFECICCKGASWSKNIFLYIIQHLTKSNPISLTLKSITKRICASTMNISVLNWPRSFAKKKVTLLYYRRNSSSTSIIKGWEFKSECQEVLGLTKNEVIERSHIILSLILTFGGLFRGLCSILNVSASKISI